MVAAAVLLGFASQAQHKVNNKAFELMLNNLLDHSVTEIMVPEALKLKQQAVFLDARAFEEYQVSHIADAQWVGYDDFDLKRVSQVAKDQPIVVYCSVGYRSEKVSEKLIAAGYLEVVNLYGGIFEWKNQGHTLVDALGTTEKVHAYNRTWGFWLKRGQKVY
jgi:rhodanese-related sulfurtransferase